MIKTEQKGEVKMNGTGLGLAAILLIVLFAVSLGAQQMDDQKAGLIADMQNQRQALIDTAEEALAQRDGEVARAAALENENAGLILALQGKDNQIAGKDAEIARLNAEIERQAAEIALLKVVPATGQPETYGAPADPGAATGVVASKSTTRAGLVMPAGVWGRLVVLGAILMGIAVIGLGGFAVFRGGANRRLSTVRMTRDQLKEYLRYQRERGKQIA
jgi:hypothetical protein